MPGEEESACRVPSIVSPPEVSSLKGHSMTETQKRYTAYYLKLIRDNPQNITAVTGEVAHIRRAWGMVSSDDEATLQWVEAVLRFQYLQGLWVEFSSWLERGLSTSGILKR